VESPDPGETTVRLPRPGQAVVRRSAGQFVAAYIMQLIAEGALKAGERVPQDEIARTLGVSRSPVRDALIALEANGLVERPPDRGAFVADMSSQLFRDHFELYGLVFGYAARRATERGDPELVAALSMLADDLRTVRDPNEVYRLADEVCRQIVEGSGVTRVRALYGSTGFFEAALRTTPDAAEVSRSSILQIVDAIARGDGGEAEVAMREMSARHADLMVDSLHGRGVF